MATRPELLLSVFLAGCDTTAGLLSFLFHVVARRPDDQAEVRTDVSIWSRQPSIREHVSKVVSESALPTSPSFPNSTCPDESCTARCQYPILICNLRRTVDNTVLPKGRSDRQPPPLGNLVTLPMCVVFMGDGLLRP